MASLEPDRFFRMVMSSPSCSGGSKGATFDKAGAGKRTAAPAGCGEGATTAEEAVGSVGNCEDACVNVGGIGHCGGHCG